MSPPPSFISPYLAQRKVFEWSAATITVALCIYLLNVFAGEGVRGVVAFVVPILVGLWIFLARERWWVLFPIAYSFGGMFYFGFRIYVYEMALVLSVLALLPMFAVTKGREERRGLVPFSAYLMLGYMCVHMVVSEYLCKMESEGGVGNILRVYVSALWPLIFLVLFFRYGSTRYLKHVLIAMYIACSLRVILGLVGYFSPRLLYVPFINLILPGTYSGGVDLRSSALLLVSLALCYTRLARPRILSMFHLAVIVATGWLILVGGSRVSLAVFCGILLLWTFLHRKWILLGTLGLCMLAVVIVFNTNPAIMRGFPVRVQRTLSILVLKSPTRDIHTMVKSSDQWHYDLMRRGVERWTGSAGSFFLGNRVLPFDRDAFSGMSSTSMLRVEVAAGMGAYESGLWTVLAVLGVAGAILYACVFLALLRGIVPDLVAHGVRDHAHSFYFLSVSGIVIWIVFAWIAGGFPSQELMMAVIAKAAYEDQRQKQNGQPA